MVSVMYQLLTTSKTSKKSYGMGGGENGVIKEKSKAEEIEVTSTRYQHQQSALDWRVP